jgi:hypothetical protein
MGVDFSVNYPPPLEDGDIKNFLDEGEMLMKFTVKNTVHGCVPGACKLTTKVSLLLQAAH